MLIKIYTGLLVLLWFVFSPLAQLCNPGTIEDEGGLLWEKCVSFRSCFIQCYLDETCRSFRINNGSLFCQGYQIWLNTGIQQGLVYRLCRERKEEVCDGRSNFQLLQRSGMCVSYNRVPARWSDARKSCRRQSADLPVLDTPTKYYDLDRHLKSITSKVFSRLVWVGMRRERSKKYDWISGNSSWRRWAPGEPTWVQQCVHFSYSGLRVFSCLSRKFFVCELNARK